MKLTITTQLNNQMTAKAKKAADGMAILNDMPQQDVWEAEREEKILHRHSKRFKQLTRENPKIEYDVIREAKEKSRA